ncbi:hypothetical protein CRV24_004352 [Beauveria bassiana]|nr:hypothetical protein CRV24_004352 [Beauveria bassiana]KAF1735429.1 hypothetical protein CRV24_004352 [Beauveria bassiana]
MIPAVSIRKHGPASASQKDSGICFTTRRTVVFIIMNSCIIASAFASQCGENLFQVKEEKNLHRGLVIEKNKKGPVDKTITAAISRRTSPVNPVERNFQPKLNRHHRWESSSSIG